MSMWSWWIDRAYSLICGRSGQGFHLSTLHRLFRRRRWRTGIPSCTSSFKRWDCDTFCMLSCHDLSMLCMYRSLCFEPHSTCRTLYGYSSVSMTPSIIVWIKKMPWHGQSESSLTVSLVVRRSIFDIYNVCIYYNTELWFFFQKMLAMSIRRELEVCKKPGP